MVIIRLSRGGVKKKPFYYIVVTDNRKSRDGKFIKKVGYFNPISNTKEKKIFFNMKLVKKWIKNGAKLSNRVFNLIKVFKKYYIK